MDPNQNPPSSPAPEPETQSPPPYPPASTPGYPPGAPYDPNSPYQTSQAPYQPGQAPYPPGQQPYQPGAPLPPGVIPAGYEPAGYPPAFAPPPKRSNRNRLISIVIAVVVVIAIGAAGTLLFGNNDKGKVVFSLKKPDSCRVSDQVTTAKTNAGQLHIVGIFNSTISSGQELKLEVIKDGISLTTVTVPHTAVDCFDDQEEINSWMPGSYKFVYKTDKTEAEGTIDITQP